MKTQIGEKRLRGGKKNGKEDFQISDRMQNTALTFNKKIH
jgi:hypothetical protein